MYFTINKTLHNFICALMLVVMSGNVSALRIKDICNVAGVRSNYLTGYGLVVGLDQSGDQTSQTPFTTQSLKNMLKRYGIAIPENVNPQLKNVAAVIVHAELPPFIKPGQRIDITVSSLGNAKSLRGGSLLITPLYGVDKQVYAIAQGELVVGGLGVEGSDGSRVTINVPSVGRIPSGAMVERQVPDVFASMKKIVLNLHQADFTTANRVVDRINRALGPATAEAIDSVSILVQTPPTTNQRVEFMSFLETLDIETAEPAAKVIINSRTGTIVINSAVTVKAAAVSHGSLTVTIKENLQVSQPDGGVNVNSQAQTVVTADSDIIVEQDNSRMFLFKPGVSLDEIVRAVNDVGAAPGDLVAILEALKQAGALNAQLIVI